MIILLKPIISEKSMKLAAEHFYTFVVSKNATKPQIAKAVTEKFSVKVLSVRTINVKGKVKSQKKVRKSYQTTGFKKAIVHLGKTQKIAMFETPKEEEVTVTTGEGEPVKLREKKDFLGRTKVKVEKTAVGTAQTTQRKVITGK